MDLNILETQLLLMSGPAKGQQSLGYGDDSYQDLFKSDNDDFQKHLELEKTSDKPPARERDNIANDEKNIDAKDTQNDNVKADSKDEQNAADQNDDQKERISKIVKNLKENGADEIAIEKIMRKLMNKSMGLQEGLAALEALAQAAGQDKISDMMADMMAGMPEAEKQAFIKKMKALSQKADGQSSVDALQTQQQNAAPNENLTAEIKASSEGKAANAEQKNVSEDNEALAALIAAGLSPQELAKAYETLVKKMTGEASEDELAALNSTLVKIKEPAQNSLTSQLLKPALAALSESTNPAALGNRFDNMHDIATRLNALTIGGKSDTAVKNDFSEILKVLEQAQNSLKNNNVQGQVQLATSQEKPNMTHALMSSTSLGNMSDYGLDSSMLAADGIDADIIAGLKAQTSSVNSLSQFTNIAQQAQQAGHPHPATQMVASKITKAAAKGQDTTLRIRLNPPELGRMSIKMEFNNETKAVKASIVVEKPETYMMMQRDAHLLEKALQDAGLETDSSSLNFELAQDGNEFDQNGRHGGHSDGNSPHNTGTEHDDGDEEIIETTLDWYVDPNTGAMRYDTLV